MSSLLVENSHRIRLVPRLFYGLIRALIFFVEGVSGVCVVFLSIFQSLLVIFIFWNTVKGDHSHTHSSDEIGSQLLLSDFWGGALACTKGRSGSKQTCVKRHLFETTFGDTFTDISKFWQDWGVLGRKAHAVCDIGWELADTDSATLDSSQPLSKSDAVSTSDGWCMPHWIMYWSHVSCLMKSFNDGRL